MTVPDRLGGWPLDAPIPGRGVVVGGTIVGRSSGSCPATGAGFHSRPTSNRATNPISPMNRSSVKSLRMIFPPLTLRSAGRTEAPSEPRRDGYEMDCD